MSNMSYCRFVNTVGDVRDCMDALRDFDAFSGDKITRLQNEAAELEDSLQGVKYDGDDPRFRELEFKCDEIQRIEEMDISSSERDSARELIELARELADEFEGIEI